jgi:hypothetical protein
MGRSVKERECDSDGKRETEWMERDRPDVVVHCRPYHACNGFGRPAPSRIAVVVTVLEVIVHHWHSSSNRHSSHGRAQPKWQCGKCTPVQMHTGVSITPAQQKPA